MNFVDVCGLLVHGLPSPHFDQKSLQTSFFKNLTLVRLTNIYITLKSPVIYRKHSLSSSKQMSRNVLSEVELKRNVCKYTYVFAHPPPHFVYDLLRKNVYF